MTGSELRAHRRAKGLSQQALSLKASVSCDTVRYWEAKAEVNLWGGASRRLLDALGMKNYRTSTRVRAGWSNTLRDKEQERQDKQSKALLAALREKTGQSCRSHSCQMRCADSQGSALPEFERSWQMTVQISRRQEHRAKNAGRPGTHRRSATSPLGTLATGSRSLIESAARDSHSGEDDRARTNADTVLRQSHVRNADQKEARLVKLAVPTWVAPAH